MPQWRKRLCSRFSSYKRGFNASSLKARLLERGTALAYSLLCAHPLRASSVSSLDVTWGTQRTEVKCLKLESRTPVWKAAPQPLPPGRGANPQQRMKSSHTGVLFTKPPMKYHTWPTSFITEDLVASQAPAETSFLLLPSDSVWEFPNCPGCLSLKEKTNQPTTEKPQHSSLLFHMQKSAPSFMFMAGTRAAFYEEAGLQKLPFVPRTLPWTTFQHKPLF